MATTLLCPGSPRSGPQLRHEQRPGAPSGCAPALREWLDGVSDALCMLPPQLRDYRPFATTATRSRLHLPGTTGLRVRSPWPAAKVEHPFPILKRVFGFRKVRNWGLEKIATRRFVACGACGLVNLYMA